MKMLYIIEDVYPPFRVDVVELFAKQMTNRGHDIEWMMIPGKQSLNGKKEINWNNNTVYLGKTSDKQGLLGKIIRNLLSITFDLSIPIRSVKGKYELIQVRDRYFAGLMAWVGAKLSGAKFTFWMSYPYPESKIEQAKNGYVKYPYLTLLKGIAIKFILYRIVLPLTDHIFVQSEQMLEDVALKGISREKMTPVPMGIKDEILDEISNPKIINREHPVLLYLGIILRLRKAEFLVKVLSLVRKKYPTAKLLYVGDGQNAGDVESVELEANKLGLTDAVTITGNLPMEHAWDYVKNADICFSPFYPIPTLLSTSPTKLIEYMAYSKPIVANDHPEQTQVLNESGVGKTVRWDENQFASAVIELLDNPEETNARAAKGPLYVRENRIYSVIARNVEIKYREILGHERSIDTCY
ncbi:MAG: glycosyltransferase [Candidatus Thiodiazotropha sp. 6PLUC2]